MKLKKTESLLLSSQFSLSSLESEPTTPNGLKRSNEPTTPNRLKISNEPTTPSDSNSLKRSNSNNKNLHSLHRSNSSNNNSIHSNKNSRHRSNSSSILSLISSSPLDTSPTSPKVIACKTPESSGGLDSSRKENVSDEESMAYVV